MPSEPKYLRKAFTPNAHKLWWPSAVAILALVQRVAKRPNRGPACSSCIGIKPFKTSLYDIIFPSAIYVD